VSSKVYLEINTANAKRKEMFRQTSGRWQVPKIFRS